MSSESTMASEPTATERELAGLQHKSIEKANQTKNPFEVIAEEYSTYKKDDLSLTIKFYSSKDIKKDLQKFCFKLAERNVSGYYKASSLGWQPKVKQTDIGKNWARFLIVYDSDKPIGYVMFRFDMDYGRSCIYCYELQIDEGYRSKGIGEHLMKALEKLAKVWSMERIVLTLLTNNDGATRFYKRLGYVLDDTSPDDEAAYDIMCKIIM